MSLKEQIPDTKQGLLTYRAYIENRLAELEREKKRLYKQDEMCIKKLEKYKGDGK